MKKLVVLALVFLFAVSFTAPVFAENLADVQGKPRPAEIDTRSGYFIWQDHDGFHLRTTTLSQKHVFSGVLLTDGDFIDFHRINAERNDKVIVTRDRNMVTFEFKTAGGTDGFDFRIREGRLITLDLYMDGRRIAPALIHLGKHARHPDRNPFIITYR